MDSRYKVKGSLLWSSAGEGGGGERRCLSLEEAFSAGGDGEGEPLPLPHLFSVIFLLGYLLFSPRTPETIASVSGQVRDALAVPYCAQLCKTFTLWDWAGSEKQGRSSTLF